MDDENHKGGSVVWLFFMMLFPWDSLAIDPNLGGWKLDKYQAEENELVENSELYLLVPPDYRASIVIRENQARFIREGILSPEQVYRNRNQSPNEQVNPSNRGDGRIVGQSVGFQDLTKALRENSVEMEVSGPMVIGASSSQPLTTSSPAISSKFDPNAYQPWPYDWEESVKACKGAFNTGAFSIAALQSLKEAPQAQHPFCGDLEIEEAARRTFYNMCNYSNGLKPEAPFPGQLRSAKVSKIWKVFNEQGEHLIFYAKAECQNGDEVDGVFSFAQATSPVDKCWVCSQVSGASVHRMEFFSRVPSSGLKTLDFQKPPRASPQMSEFPDSEIPGYWKIR